jgi:hypothetical protein
MTRLSIKQSQILTLSYLLVVILAIGGLVIIPTIRAIFTAEARVGELQSTLTAQHNSAKQLRRSIQEIESITTEVMPYTQATIALGSELEFITELQTIAESLNIDQTINVQFSKERTAGKLGQHFTISFLQHGTYANHLAFLRELERLDPYVIIPSVEFSLRSAKEDDQPITLKFEATVYAYDI